MLMLDLDHFKSINDRFGHAIGDEVLRVFANAARSNMRGSDLVGRLGGEEFAVIVAEPMEFAARIGRAPARELRDRRHSDWRHMRSARR